SVTPYYNKPNQEGLYAHFSEVAKSINIPIMVYNNPGRTCSYAELKTIVSLNKKYPHISAVKESSGKLDMFTDIQNENADIDVYIGDDVSLLPALSVGAAGVVSVSSHLVASQMNDLINNFNDKDLKTAVKIHNRLNSLFKVLFSSPSPGPVKHLLAKNNLCKPFLRLPLTPPAESVRLSIEEVWKDIELFQKELAI
ncbi:MAG TPA: dihydrodipicolinate synthase family protein, partial [Vampirovibrionales bacterium]